MTTTNTKHHETTLPTARALRRGTAAAATAIFLMTVAATWLSSPGEARAAAATVTCAPNASEAFSKKTRKKAQEAMATGDARVAEADGKRAKPASKARAKARTKKGKALAGVLNLNTATEAQLRMLPGIGEAKAARIVAWREAHGPFPRVVDLRRVKGFGKKTVDRLADYLTVKGKTTLRYE